MDKDLEKGFVLRADEAMKYLIEIAVEHAKEVMEGNEGCEGMSEMFDDLFTMKHDIEMGNVEYFKFVECPMAASGINIIPMVEKE